MRRRHRTIDRLLGELEADNAEARIEALGALELLQLRWDRAPRPSARQIDQVFYAIRAHLRRDPAPGARHAAARALTFWFEARAPAALLPVLEDIGEDPQVRGQAAEGIGNVLGSHTGARALRASAIAALRRGLADASAEVRFWCLYALGSMRATEARADIEHLAGTDEGMCPFMWRVSHEAADVLTYWKDGVWPDREFDPGARPKAT